MFREQIRKHYDHLSRSYRRVADFILSDYRTAAFMTAAALADAVDVDTTTVVRFAQRLGYPGFPELIEDIQEHEDKDRALIGLLLERNRSGPYPEGVRTAQAAHGQRARLRFGFTQAGAAQQ